MTAARVGLVYPLQYADIRAALDEVADVRVAESPDEDGVDALVQSVEGIIVRGPAKLTGKQIEGATELRVIAATGSGTDHIDVVTATARGIPVVSGAGAAPESVAEFTLGAMIAGRRNFLPSHNALVSGELEWRGRVERFASLGMAGTTVGLVGFGHIARLVAQMTIDVFGCRVIAFDPYVTDSGNSAVSIVEDLDELFSASDTVSIHTPLLPDTRGLISRAQLRRLGPRGVLVDTARGGVVNEVALCEALLAGEIGGAVLDVFDSEPPTPDQLERLRATPNLLVTPHIAGITDQARRKLEQNAVEQVLMALRGERPSRLVNHEVLFP